MPVPLPLMLLGAGVAIAAVTAAAGRKGPPPDWVTLDDWASPDERWFIRWYTDQAGDRPWIWWDIYDRGEFVYSPLHDEDAGFVTSLALAKVKAMQWVGEQG